MEINDIIAAVKKDLAEIDRLNKEIGILVDMRDGLLGKIKQLEELFGSFRTQKIPSVEGTTSSKQKGASFNKPPGCVTNSSEIFFRMVKDLITTHSWAHFTVASVYRTNPTISTYFSRDQVSACVFIYIQCGFIEKKNSKAYGITSAGMEYYQQNKDRLPEEHQD